MLVLFLIFQSGVGGQNGHLVARHVELEKRIEDVVVAMIGKDSMTLLVLEILQTESPVWKINAKVRRFLIFNPVWKINVNVRWILIFYSFCVENKCWIKVHTLRVNIHDLLR